MKFSNVKRIFLQALLILSGLLFFVLPVMAEDFGSWETKASVSTGRYGLGAVTVNGKIYAMGGSYNSGANFYVKELEEYNAETNTWAEKANMLSSRSFFSVAVVNNKIYAIGGLNASGAGVNYYKTVEEYDPATNTWTKKTDMPTARSHIGVAVLGGKIYAIAGYDNSGVLRTVEVYDPATDIWTSLTSAPTARRTNAISVNGKIYVIGGYSGSDYIKTVEEYDPETDIWTKKKDMPTARFTPLETINNRIYAFGGANVPITGLEGSTNAVEEYDISTDTWRSLESMTFARYGHAVTELNGKIYTIGGATSSTYVPTVETFTVPAYPSDPPILTATPGTALVNLSWNAIHEAIGYTLYRSLTSGGPYTEVTHITNITYTDTDITNGTAYYYVVTATNNGGESKYSNEVSAVPQSPDVTLDIDSIGKANIGDEITADIVTHNASTICAEDIKISYDTNLLEYIGAVEADGMKIYKEADLGSGTHRYITASLGKANAANGDKVLLKLKFKAKAPGQAKVDILKGRIADNATLEADVTDENCGEKIITIEGTKDVNRTGQFTLLDLGIDAWYYGDPSSATDTSRYDADVVADGQIDDGDLQEIVKQMLENANYPVNN